MSDQEHKEIELFANNPDDSNADSDDDTKSEQNLGNDLLQNSDKEAIREANAQKQAEAWAKRVANGEALPANLEWLKPRIEALNSLKKEAPNYEEIIAEKVNKQLAEERNQIKFTELVASINQMKLNKGQRETLQSEFNELVSAGIPSAKALEKAAKLSGLQLLSQAEASRQDLRRNMNIPVGGYAPEEADVFKKDIKDRLSSYEQMLKE